MSRLEAELVEQVRPLSHESLQTRAWRKQRQPSAGGLRSDRNNHRRSAFKTLCQSSETGIQRRPKESTDSPQKRLNSFIEINSLLSQRIISIFGLLLNRTQNHREQTPLLKTLTFVTAK